MVVLVTGIRGGIGRRVADLLHDAGVEVRAGSTSPADVSDVDYPVVPVNLRSGAGLAEALRGVDRIFLYAAADGIDQVATQLCRSAVSQVVVLSSSAVDIPAAQSFSGHHKVVEEAVAATGTGATYLRPGAFAGNTRACASQIRTGHLELPYPDAYVEPIHEDDIADAAVAALTDPAVHRGRAYLLTGAESLTQREQVDQIAAAAGHPVIVEELSDDGWRRQVEQLMPEYVSDALLSLWRDSVGRPGRTDSTILEVTGAKPRAFAEWAAEHATEFARQ